MKARNLRGCTTVLAAPWAAEQQVFLGRKNHLKPPAAMPAAFLLSSVINPWRQRNINSKSARRRRAKRNEIMDNILKLIVGCLGLVGLVVMIIPNSDPLANKNGDAADVPSQSPDGAAAVANGAPPPPPPPPDPNASTQAKPSNVIVEDYNIGNFGEPMVDPTPPGQRNQQQSQPYQPPQYNGAGNSAQQAADAAGAAAAAADAAAQQAQQQSF
jgi:hypothetical protein